MRKQTNIGSLLNGTEKTGLSIRGDLPNVWLVRINHTYLGDSRINVGKQGIHSHGHAWGLIANINEWTWEENNK
ncbi:Uncharacterised protein [Streptobacillus moniliformis]|nr:Uncharacterised protein [Streptobacillus moniliformis]